MQTTITLGDGFVAVSPFPESLLPKLRYWKRSLVFNQRTHRREMQATGETLYRIEEGAADDGTPSRTCITLPGFAKRCKDHLVSCGWVVDVVDSRTPMPEPDMAKAMTGLRQYQYGLVYDMLMSGGGVLAGATGCHAKGERVLCAEGRAMAVEDVRIGDRLLGHDGTPRTVVALHHGVKPCWRVVPVKGDPFVVTEDHMLTLARRLDGALVDIRVDAWTGLREEERQSLSLVRIRPHADVEYVRFSCIPVGDREYFGFTVDGDNRYLLPDFTVTHNCGKTHIMKALCNAYPHDALMARGTPTIVVAVPDKDITRKNFDDLTAILPDRRVGLVMSGSRNFSDDIQVITLDSLHLLNADDVGVMIVDEMHTASSDTRAAELLRFTKARTWGVSATPDGRFDGKDAVAEGIFGPVVARFSYADGVRAGCLVPITVYWIDCPEPNIGLECYLRYKNRDQRYRWGVYDNRARNQLVGRIFAGTPKSLQTLGMLQFTRHMEKVLRGCAEAGCNPLPTQAHAGTDPSAFPASSFWHVKPISAKERKAIYADMRDGKTRQAISTYIWRQGVNFVDLSVVVNIGGGGSEIVSQQVPGRASRKVDGKDRAYIVEFRHGWDVMRGKSGRTVPGPVLRDDESRKKIYDELGFEQIHLENERGLPWMSSSGSPTP